MINTRFSYASTKTGFGPALGSGSTALQNLQAKRAGIASSLASAQARLNSITSSFASAQQDKINGLGILAAQAAIARVQADAKAKAAEITKNIDAAQAAVDNAKSINGPTIVGNTVIQKYSSWALTPTVDESA